MLQINLLSRAGQFGKKMKFLQNIWPIHDFLRFLASQHENVTLTWSSNFFFISPLVKET